MRALADRTRLKWTRLLPYLAGAVAAAAVGATASLQAPAFYLTLTRPAFAPPPWIFGPVWTVLYILMAVSAWLVSSVDAPARRPALVLWWIQLAVNAAWTWLFFAWHSGVWALVDIAVLFALVVALVVAFWRIRRAAGAMLVPYLLWVGFATALTVAVWRLNPGVL